MHFGDPPRGREDGRGGARWVREVRMLFGEARRRRREGPLDVGEGWFGAGRTPGEGSTDGLRAFEMREGLPVVDGVDHEVRAVGGGRATMVEDERGRGAMTPVWHRGQR